jgi:hypothetical protein
MVTLCCPTIASWCFAIIALSSRIATLPSHFNALPCKLFSLVVHCYYLPFSSTFWAPPHCCFTALLFIVVPCFFTLSIGTPSPHSCVGGGTWNNSNKLHPTIEVFLLDFMSFFSLLCILFVLFLFVNFFELNTFCFSVVYEL